MTARSTKEFKLLAGTSRADRDYQPDAPAPDALNAMPEAPQYLNADGKEAWLSEGNQLIAQGRLRQLHLKPFGQLCYAWQQFLQKAKAGLEVNASEQNMIFAFWKQFDCMPGSAIGKPLAPPEKEQTQNPFVKNRRA